MSDMDAHYRRDQETARLCREAREALGRLIAWGGSEPLPVEEWQAKLAGVEDHIVRRWD